MKGATDVLVNKITNSLNSYNTTLVSKVDNLIIFDGEEANVME